MFQCSICKCAVTVPYRNPLGAGDITCWFHADYFYSMHPERLAGARLKQKDIPNFLVSDKIWGTSNE
jgi:hypothetical protein